MDVTLSGFLISPWQILLSLISYFFLFLKWENKPLLYASVLFLYPPSSDIKEYHMLNSIYSVYGIYTSIDNVNIFPVLKTKMPHTQLNSIIKLK